MTNVHPETTLGSNVPQGSHTTPVNPSAFPDAISLSPHSEPLPIPSNIPVQLVTQGNATTCRSFTFSWSFHGESVWPMTLAIVKRQDMSHAQPVTTPAVPVLRTLSTDVASDIRTYTWSVVDIAEGWHSIIASGTSSTTDGPVQSASFFVRNGSDVSCLDHGLFHHGPTPSNHRAPGHARLSTGEWIGIVLGAGAGIIILVAAFVFPRLWRRALPSLKKRRMYLLY